MERLIVETQGARLRKEGERLNVCLDGKVVQAVPLGPLQQVVLMGRGVSASTALLYDLVRRGVDVVYQSQAGRFGFRLVGPAPGHSALRVQQVLVATHAQRSLDLARAVVRGKLHNQAVVLRHYAQALGDRGGQALATLAAQMRQAAAAESLEALRGHEGSGAAAYFGAWPALVDAGLWRFAGRAYYPPPDPINALLSFGYTLLLNDVLGAVYRIGLDPGIGFYHTVDYGRPSLALDLEEEFRPVLVDRLVLRLVREGTLEPADFAAAEGRPGVIMSDDARRLFLQCYEEQLAIRVQHPALAQNLTYRQCIDRQAEHLARCILGREEQYLAMLIR
jgi:CRISP-associated protein Cas1